MTENVVPSPIEPPSRRAAIILNPSKKVAADLRQTLSAICSEEGWAEPLWLETTVDDPGAGQTRQALAEDVDLVIAAGGDGTVRCIAEVLAGTNTALGLVPLGTGNLLARNLGLDVTDPSTSARLALTHGQDRPIDVVKAVVDHADKEQSFLVMAGLGFDAAVMADTNDTLKDKVGWMAYVDAGIRNLPGRPVKAKISIDGARPLTRRVRSIMGGNCGKLQGGLEIFPGAKFDDGVLEIMTVAPSGRLGWFAVLAGLIRRGEAKDPAVEYFQGKTVDISFDAPQAVQLDGDHIGEARHLTMTVHPGALLIRWAAANSLSRT